VTRRLAHTPDGAPSRGPRETIFELDAGDARTADDSALDVPEVPLERLLGDRVRLQPPALPDVTEVQVARHYAHLASLNFGVDTGSYPLGSCTMKYNPRVSEDACRAPGFAGLHPEQPAETVQGALRLMFELQEALAEISGLPAVSLQPAAGAHGELTALMCIRAFHTHRDGPRTRVIIPDSAHGTNPATVAMCGYSVAQVPSDERGGVDVRALREVLDTDVAALMLTNPNTLGLFDENIAEITSAVHEVGALAFCDGANLNAVMGVARPGDMGFDAMHINLHKTFATPHGGGGPGAGPVCVTAELAEYLPRPVVSRKGEGYVLTDPNRSIGRVRSFFGNFGVHVRAYAYIMGLGGVGLREASEQAVLSANYLKSRLYGVYDVPYDRTCMHEFVLSGSRQKRENGVRTLDIAKRLLDHGMHPPTVYFPLIVEEALMVEPTETESLEDLDRLAEALIAIAAEAERDPETVRHAPYTTPVRRLDEARAARDPVLRWRPRG